MLLFGLVSVSSVMSSCAAGYGNPGWGLRMGGGLFDMMPLNHLIRRWMTMADAGGIRVDSMSLGRWRWWKDVAGDGMWMCGGVERSGEISMDQSISILAKK